MNGAIDSIGGRKFAAWLLCFALGAAATIIHIIHGGDDMPQNIRGFMEFSTGFFFAMNIARHFIAAKGEIKAGAQ